MARSYPCPNCGAFVLPSDSRAAEKVTCPNCHAEVPNPARQVTVARIQTRSRPSAPAKHVGEDDPAEDYTRPRVADSSWKMWLTMHVFVCALFLIASILVGFYVFLFGFRAIAVLIVGFALVVFLAVWLSALRVTRPEAKGIVAETATHQDIWLVGVVFLVLVPVVVAIGIVLFAACTGGHGF